MKSEHFPTNNRFVVVSIRFAQQWEFRKQKQITAVNGLHTLHNKFADKLWPAATQRAMAGGGDKENHYLFRGGSLWLPLATL